MRSCEDAAWCAWSGRTRVTVVARVGQSAVRWGCGVVVAQGLEKCRMLEELCLEENNIVQLDGLSSLRSLKSLDLGKNRVTSLDGLEGLLQLAQLSLEDNEIERLMGLTTLTALMELYIGNNKIAKLNEVQNLKGLSKLIILDLSGNHLADDSQCVPLDVPAHLLPHHSPPARRACSAEYRSATEAV